MQQRAGGPVVSLSPSDGVAEDGVAEPLIEGAHGVGCCIKLK